MENTSILVYLLKSTVAFTALYGLYILLFRKNQQFAISRFYLVFTIVFASLFPFIKFITYKTVEIPAFETAIPEVTGVGSQIIANQPAVSFWNQLNINNVTLYLYLLVSSLILVRLLYMLIRFGVNLFNHSRVERLYGKRVIVSDYWNQTFSFFGIIVLPQKDFQLKENQLLIQHELVHVRQFHTLDLLLAELFQVLHWFNPLAHFIKKDMREVHEFLADFNVVKGGASKYAYQQLLLNYLASSVTPRVANSFSAKLLKKRFAMMTTNKTPKSVLFKYLLTIPVVAVLIGLMSFQTEVKYVEKKTQPILKETTNNLSNSRITAKNNFKKETQQKEIIKSPHKKDTINEMLARLRKNSGSQSEIKIYSINKENTINEIIVLKKGVVYKLYLVGEHTNKMIKTHVALLKENKDEKKEVLPSKIDMIPGQNCFEYQCKETGVYRLTLINKEEGERYIVGVYFKEMFDVPDDKDENVEIVEVNVNTKKQQIDTLNYEPFVIVEEMPKFNNKGLEAARGYIAKNLKYPDKAFEKEIKGQVLVSFIIETDGRVSNPKIERGMDPLLDTEVIRVVQNMPKWTPGFQQGKAVRVKFTIPIVFILNNNSEKNSEAKKTPIILVENYEPFVMVEKMPKFSNSDDISLASNYIAQNTKYPAIAKENGIQGKVYVTFVVEEDGSVTNVKIERGVDPSIDNEAIRVIESMPKWTPGYQRGQAVRVKITLPVIFKLDDKK